MSIHKKVRSFLEGFYSVFTSLEDEVLCYKEVNLLSYIYLVEELIQKSLKRFNIT